MFRRMVELDMYFGRCAETSYFEWVYGNRGMEMAINLYTQEYANKEKGIARRDDFSAYQLHPNVAPCEWMDTSSLVSVSSLFKSINIT